MVAKRTINFLPKVFQTNTNRRFLNATMDQLIQEPNFGRIYGYIGRQDLSPAYQSGDAYVNEVDSYSQFYQLEPGLVINKRIPNTDRFKKDNAYNYVDLLNAIAVEGGINTDHSRLFANEYYNYEGFVDLDKLINYNKYYWMPNGPQTVYVNSGGISLNEDFKITRPLESDVISKTAINRNIGNIGYQFNTQPDKSNPIITLVRGGSYTFNVSQIGHKFWIQTEPGLGAGSAFQDNIIKRDVFGVVNNGAEVGTITFNVPNRDSQNFYENMQVFDKIDAVTELPFSQIQNANVIEFFKKYDIDGIGALSSTKLIFINNTQDDYWYEPDNYDDVNFPYDASLYDRGAQIDQKKRKGIWQMADVGGKIRLTYVRDWPKNTRLFVREGTSYGHLHVFKDSLLNVYKSPNITAPNQTLYYQDSVDANVYGEIRLVDPDPISIIDVNTIIGQPEYTSPNGVKFTSGLKVKFTGSVTPEEYANREFVIEGCGKSIALVPWLDLITPDPNNPNLGDGYADDSEPYDTTNYDFTLNAPLRKDYIVINRASIDGNPWTRTNRWFHEDVIKYAITFNNTFAPIVLDNNNRAIRPIIEFDANLQLWNHGSRFLNSVTAVDTYVTDKSNQVEGRSPYVLIDNEGNYFSDNVALENDTLVIFTQERYPNTKNKVYRVQNIRPHSDLPSTKTTVEFQAIGTKELKFTTVNNLYINMKVVGANIPANTVIMSIDSYNKTVVLNNVLSENVPVGSLVTFTSDLPQVHLVPEYDVVQGDTVVAISGVHRQNKMYWWNNGNWEAAQQKTSLNQNPLFDVFNLDGISWGNKDYYSASTFAGCKLFGYKEASSGTRDKELGIALSYRSVGNIGDIVFENYYDTDTFNFSFNNKDQVLEIAKGYVHEITTGKVRLRNNWTKVTELSKQYIQKKYVAVENRLNNFDIDVGFKNSFTEKNIFVFVNGKEIQHSDFTLFGDNTKSTIIFANELVVGDILVVKLIGQPQGNKENYTIPKNLIDNSQNETFSTLTLGQIRNHLLEITANSLDFKGEPSGSNNLRDINYKVIPGKILQHSAGVHIAQLMFNNETTNIVKAIDFNRRAYNRFKDRFLYLLSTLEFPDIDNTKSCLDIIMEEITNNNSSDQSFYYTDMLPYGTNNFIVNEYTVVDTTYRKFNLINSFDVANSGYQAVLVYINDNLLLFGQDYTVNGQTVQITKGFKLSINDVIKIYEYDSTVGCMVPATPSKLGLYPKYTPMIFNDFTYVSSPQVVIQGHDGSKMLAFNDYRDNIILEFEKRIYNNINSEYFSDPNLGLSDIEPGAFRRSDYSIDEWTQLLSGSFLSWAGNNNVAVFENNTIQNDPFSFNYSQGIDKVFGESLPGYWRGIYRYFFDTDQPHTHPWEMFGFSQKPDWWEMRYGPAPYTSGNLVLWKDVELGLIYRRGYDSYIDSRFARPGVLSIIPVDSHGDLVPPVSFIVNNWNQQTAGASWRFGDQSPQETVWRRSSDYPYAMQIAWALARPAQYCNLSMNRRDLIRIDNLDQIINRKNANRKFDLLITNKDQYIPGANIWIRDRLTDLSLDITENFEEIFKNHSINLMYKASGYTDKEYIQVIADQSSPNSTNTGVIVPQENYEVLLTKSAPVGLASYSAVIVQKSATGFSVYGFDRNRPYFTIIPRRYNSNSYNIKISESSAVVYNDDENSIQTIPYGTQLTTRQQVVDFLISYGKYLSSLGFQFVDTTNIDSVPTVADWSLSVKEFLFWIEQGWDNNTVISLTPAGTKINFDGNFGIVDSLTNSFNGSRIISSDGRVLQGKDYTTYRSGTAFELAVKDQSKGIHLVDMSVVQYEHTIVFDNTTVFNDIIYEPNLGNRQWRLKINGFKTREWDGSLYAPGFVINHKSIEQWMQMQDYFKGDIVRYKNFFYTARQFIPGSSKFEQSHWHKISSELIGRQLIPNLAFNVQQFENFYDIDQLDVNRTADMLGRKSTGFTRRKYLSNIGLDDISQHKFYLGMIREKGTQSAVNAFLRAKLPYLNSEVKIDEQWAIRLGSYGGSDLKTDIEVSLAGAKQLNGAYLIEFLDQNQSNATRWNSYRPQDLLIKPAVYSPALFEQTEDYPTVVANAGPVSIEEVNATVFDIQKIFNINGAASSLMDGSRIWVAADKSNSWSVLRVTADENILVTNSVVINDEIEFTCDRPHGLELNENVLLKKATVRNSNSNFNLSGFYRINSVAGNSFKVKINSAINAASGTMKAQLLKLKPVKYSSKAKFAVDSPQRGWQENDKVWISKGTDDYNVLALDNKWAYQTSLTPTFTDVDDHFSNSIDIKSTQDIAVAGSPFKDATGAVYVYNINAENNWGFIEGVAPDDAYAAAFGFSVNYNNLNLVAVGAPDSISSSGLAYIMTTTTNDIGIVQVINVAGLALGAKFGQTVSSSTDGKWLAISAPGINTVYTFKLVTVSQPQKVYKVTQGVAVHQIPESALGLGLATADLKVKLGDKLLVPFIDYTVTGNNVVLANTPGAEEFIEIVYDTWYKLVGSITGTGNFGHSIDFAKDGTQLVVGAPLKSQFGPSEYQNLGEAYVYQRTIESFQTAISTSSFLLENDPIEIDVYLNGALTKEFSLSDKILTLNAPASAGSLLSVETNNFKLLSTITPANKQDNLLFGSKVKICGNVCSLYIGAPGYNNRGRNNGAVYRYVNSGRLYGTLVAQKVRSADINIGDSLRLNDYKVTFTGTTLAQVAVDINLANIPGVTAAIQTGGYLVIQSNSTIVANKLIVGVSHNSAIDKIAISPFDQYQVINAPIDQDTIDFGSQFDLVQEADKLVVGATIATSKTQLSFDSNRTSLDGRSTRIFSSSYRSGAAFLYEYQADDDETAATHGNFTFAQTFSLNTLETDDKFATSLAISKNWIMIGALNSRVNAGTVYMYYNKTGQNNWKVERTNLKKVDTRKIERIYLYNNNTQTLIEELPVIDPEHGMPVVAAAEQLKYIVNYDPAVYSNVPNAHSFASDARNAWAEEHVGELWWDTNQIKYVDWNQGSLVDRLNNWGLAFPSSYVSVYEWVESDVLPSQYALQHPTDGPVYTVSDVYTSKTKIEADTLQPITKYYFWVRNSNANSSLKKRDSALALQNLIANPRNNSRPFAAVVANNAIVLFNCQDLINNDTRLHVSIRANQNVNPIHQEWSMFDDGSDLGVATEFLERLNDSLSGEDATGRIVPDQNLTEKQRYGIDIRPRQTTFADKFAARQAWVNNVNQVFAQYPMALLRDLSVLNQFDPLPMVDSNTLGNLVATKEEIEYLNKDFYLLGDKVLVVNDIDTGGWSLRKLSLDPRDQSKKSWEISQVQSYDLRNYWTYSDWYAKQFNAATKIDMFVDYEYQLANAELKIGQVVKIKNAAEGNWKLVLVQENSLELIGQQNATIQLSDKLWDYSSGGFGIDYQSFEISPYAAEASAEFRLIFEAVNYKLLTQELRVEYKKIIKVLIDIIATQFKQNDWLLKTSLINIKHNVRSLDPIPVYVKQPEEFVAGFINEVKPYHTKIKQYVSSYDKIDNAQFDVTDFDLPAYYNNSLGKYRQPQFKNAVDDAAIGNLIYRPWINNHTYGLEYIEIFNGGKNYTSNTRVVVNGDGTGATAEVFVRAGKIVDIVISNPGYGYTYAEVLVIGSGSGAQAYAKLGRTGARTIKTRINFDRYTYKQTVKDWQPDTVYSAADLIVFKSEVFRPAIDSVSTVMPMGTLKTGITFSAENLIKLSVKVWEPNKPYAKDTIIVRNRIAYVALTDFVSGRYFEFNDNVSVTHSVNWQSNTDYTVDQVVSYNGAAYITAADFTSGASFNQTNLVRLYDIAKYPGGYFDDAANRVWAYYNPTSGMAGRDLAQVMSGIKYPGVNVIGPNFDQVPGYGFGLYEQISYDTRTIDENGLTNIVGDQSIDTNLTSLYKNTQLGLSPEDIITDGAAYVDSYNSHAPEELVPGHLFDALDIRVKTLGNTALGSSPDLKTIGYYGDGVRTQFSFDPAITKNSYPIGGLESINVLIDFTGPQIEGVDYTINWATQSIVFSTAPAIGSTVFVGLIGASGQGNIVDATFVGNGSQTEFLVQDVTLNSVQQVYIKINGKKSSDWHLVRPNNAANWLPITAYKAGDFLIYNNIVYRVNDYFVSGTTFDRTMLSAANSVVIKFDNPPAAGDQIQIHLYDLPANVKAYSEIIVKNYNVPENYVSGPFGFKINFEEPISYKQPWESMIKVQVNGIYLEPSNQAYYTGNGTKRTFSLPTKRNTNVTAISDSDIVVVVDNATMSNIVDYTINRLSPDMPTITFNKSPKSNSLIVISNKSTSEFSVYNSNELIIKDLNNRLAPGDRITVTTYGNHDHYDFQVEVLSGSLTETSSVQLGFDEIGFDLTGFQNEFTNVISTPTYQTLRPVNNYNYITVTLNGVVLVPIYDYIIANENNIRINSEFGITSDDVIVLTHISEKTRQPNLEYRIFKGITETYEYLGISANTVTVLAKDLFQDDKWIYVNSIDVLSQPDPAAATPGVVFVNGERITFYVLDVINKRLGQLRRATNGTGAPLVHKAGLKVYDASYKVEIPNARDTYTSAQVDTTVISKTRGQIIVPAGKLIRKGQTWLDSSTSTPANGLGLSAANTRQANFLRNL